MASRSRRRGLVAMVLGLMFGLVLGGFWPSTPLHAVSTDRTEGYIVATGPVDSEVEAIYMLDALTGDLSALILGKQPGKWSGYFKTNVAAEMGLDRQKDSKFAMVTGIAGLRRAGGSRQQPSSAVCYVVEKVSGKIAAFAVPWSPSMFAAGQAQSGPLVVVGPVTHFRQGLNTMNTGPKSRARD